MIESGVVPWLFLLGPWLGLYALAVILGLTKPSPSEEKLAQIVREAESRPVRPEPDYR